MFLRACVLGTMHLPGRCVVVVWMLCVQRNAVPGKTPTSPPLPSTHPSSHPSEPAPVHPSLPHRASLPADIPLPVPYPFLSIFLPLHPSMSSSLPALFSPSLLLSLPLSFHGHPKWLQINQRHSTEFVSEPLLWESEATHPGVCRPHN